MRRMQRNSHPRPRFPKATPPGLNHSILTGTLVDEPHPARSPFGDPVTLLRIEFPVADPAHPQMLWTWASCEVEVPAALAEQHGIRELQGGAPILTVGPLSERRISQDERASKRGAIVAALLHPGAPARPA